MGSGEILAGAEKEVMPIAIVGIGCRLPGGASNPEKLWDLLARKQSACKEIPPERFNVDAFHHPNADKNGTLNNRGGHFLEEDIAAFDAPFFSISPAEALSMDPMQRLLLEVTYEAMENAGIPLSTLAGSDTGCYVGCFTSDYDQIAKRDPELLPKYHSIGTGQAILSNRLSFCFDLKGPSVTLDTACSSSLVALHLACQSIRTGESKTAIVGATHAILNPDVMVGMTNLHFLSPDSKCYTFDSRANGYARGEGMAAVILKPLSDAIRDGDTVRAVIRGTAVNSTGNNTGITVPSREAQAQLIRTAYQQAGCDPAVTAYCEAHGTGTQAGDPIEASAIGEALGAYRPDGEDAKLFVGSVKTNIGHLEGASGLAGLIKAVMSLEKGFIAPNLWFEQGNPAIDFDAWRIRVPTELTPWPVSGLRRVSVNSFGYGGTNGHVILDDAYHYMRQRQLLGKHRTIPPPEHDHSCTEALIPSTASDTASSDTSPSGANTPASSAESMTQPSFTALSGHPRIFHISAHESGLVINSAKSYAEHLASSDSDNEELLLDDLAFTLCERRSRHAYGCTVIASSPKELIDGLRSMSTTTKRQSEAPRIGFVFTGQGAQWWAMGRELIQYPVFAQSLAACNKAVQSFSDSWSLLEELLKDHRSSRINEAEISQPLCSALQICLVDLYASWNIHPARVVGHSSGEIAAAYATGALTLESAMCAAYLRGLLSPRVKMLGYKGGMLAAGMSEEEALKDIQSMGDSFGKIVVACVNSPRSVTLSGDMAALNEMQNVLTSRKVFARKLQIETAYHSHHMLAIADEYRRSLGSLEVIPWEKRKHVAMFSSVYAREITSQDDLSASYWVNNMVSCVRFSDALAGLCQQADDKTKPVDVLVELGPHSALAGPVKQMLSSLPEPAHGSYQIQYLSAIVRDKGVQRGAAVTALTAAASLYTQGYPVDLHAANFSHPASTSNPSVLSDLPTYSWNHSRTYWSESRISRDYRFRPFARTDILGAPSHDWNPLEPRWRNFIRLSEQPWVRSHVVQGATVYPAAGFCCMALQAASQMSTLSAKARGGSESEQSVAEFKVRNLDITRALIVPETEEGVEVIFSMLPEPTNRDMTWREFRVFSYTTSDGWAEHCRGLVSVVYRSDPKALVGVDEDHESNVKKAQKACETSISQEDLYAGLDSVGLYYGPEFQGIIDISAGHDKALGTVQVTDTASGMPNGFEFPRLMHPATMDTFLQMSIAALTQGDMSNLTQPYVPTWIQEVTLSGALSALPGQKLQVAAESKRHGFREVRASVTAMAEDAKSFVRMQGVKLLAIAPTPPDDATLSIPSHTAIAAWEPDVDLLPREKMNDVLRSSIKSNHNRLRMRDLEFLAYYFFDRVLNEIDEAEVPNMHPHHQKFFHYMKHQRDLVQSHKHEQQTEEWSKLNDPHVLARLEGLMKDFSNDSDYEGTMFVRMGHALTSVLRKEAEPLALMMKDNLLYNYYTVALGTHGTYPQVQKYISILSHKYPDLDYLEIGAGTGGCTTPVLEALGGASGRTYPRMKSYTYTDISSGFFEQAAEKFSDWAEIMEFAKLDVEQDPSAQVGFENRQFDVVIAANVLHATYDIDRTMNHARKLLRPGGKLVLLDMTHSVLSVSLIFGNLSGWWNCSEPWREYGPLLSESQWQNVLINNGFTDLQASTADVLDPLEEQTRVIVATAVDSKVVINDQKTPSRTLIVKASSVPSSSDDLIKETMVGLNNAGLSVDVCTLKESQGQDLTRTAIVSFAELDESLLSDISPDDLIALQHLAQGSTGLIWVTRGGVAAKGARPELSLFHGLARSLRAEREGIPCVTVDLDLERQLPGHEAADLLLGVFKQNFGVDLAHDVGVIDREFSEEGGILRIKRAIENSKLNQRIAAERKSIPMEAEPQDLLQVARPLQIKIRSVGKLDSLVFDVDPIAAQQLPEDHVQIEVRAVGLNQRDMLVCMGDVVDEHLGNECAGVVTQVGSAVHNIVVGDRVAAWCLGSFATVVRTPENCVQKISDTMSYGTAAALPIAFVTASYGLEQVARIRKDDSVLIHSAASSVGQAAIQIAKLHGAQIFATVGSDEKKTHLVETYGVPENHIFSNQDLSFAGAVRRATGGRGVDIVLNTLSGEALRATWEIIAPFGRFIETAKTDVDLNGLEKVPSAKNITVTAIDVNAILRQDSKLAAEIFSKIMDLAKAGSIKEASPLLVQPFFKIQGSMHLMQDEEHEGKIVFEPRSGDLVPVIPKALERINFRSDASYLLSGGLGGLGRSMSRWMVQKGARNLIYVSRHGASSPEAVSLIRELEASGVRTKVIECDITDEQQLSESLSTALDTMPPLRGVIQGAMVLQDQVFNNMSHDAFVGCLKPKVKGSWSLHQATLQQPLDFFLLLSSCASFWGNAGQSNYAAGCTYQVALAAHRRSLGLAATAVDIGKVASVGFVAENAGTTSERNLVKLGLLGISEDELLLMLEMAMLPPSSERAAHMPNGHLVTGVSSSNDPANGVELPFWSRDPVFSHMDFVRQHLRKTKGNANGANAAAAQKQLPLPELLASASSARDADTYVLEALLQKLARALLMSLEEMDAQKPTSSFGVDSLVAVELRNWISREAKVDVPVFEILQASSLAVLASKVAARSPLVKVKE